ncbi:MAG: zinc-binding alcohol dehydrogenase family protein [Dehalococcoidia bacterium]
MKAAVYYKTGGPDVFAYEDVPDPVLRPRSVLIRVGAVGIQGGDVLNRAGGELASHPHIVGYQAAGIIEATGDAVEGLRPGQQVVATMPFGSHAELVSVPPQAVYVVPDSLDVQAAACIPIEFGTAHDCLFEFGALRAGEIVLVQAGASGVGLAAVQLATRAGATVLATASSDDRLARLAEYGCDHGINYVTQDLAAETYRLTGGHGADLVVDSVGGKTLEASIAALAYRGRVAWVGQAGREADPPQLSGIMQKNASIHGVFLGAEFAAQPARTRAMVEETIARVATGELRVAIDRAFPLREAAEAHRYIESRQAFGRVVLVP